MTQTITRLTGQALLDYVNANQSMTHTERCTGAGYMKDLENGSQGCAFTEFFEAILDARKGNGEITITEPTEYYEMNGRDWYEDVLTDQGRELYDMIEDLCPEFSKLDANQCQEFMDELSDLGITTASQFEDAFDYQSDAWNAECEFAQYWTEDVMGVNLSDDMSYLVIDWQATWDSALCYDFSTIEFDGETYFFNNNF